MSGSERASFTLIQTASPLVNEAMALKYALANTFKIFLNIIRKNNNTSQQVAMKMKVIYITFVTLAF